MHPVLVQVQRISAPPGRRPYDTSPPLSPAFYSLPSICKICNIHEPRSNNSYPSDDTKYHPHNSKMDFDPTVDVDAFTTLIACYDLDLQNLIRLPVGAGEYSLSVLSKLFEVFMRYHGKDIWKRSGTILVEWEGMEKQENR